MPELRIRGSETALRVTSGGIIQRTFTAIENWTWTVFSEILQKGYVNETTDRYDTIYKGTGIDFNLDPQSADSFLLMQTIADRGARRGAQSDTQINVAFTANFPDGRRPRVVITDLNIADPSIGAQNRDAYVSQKLNGKASFFKISGL